MKIHDPLDEIFGRGSKIKVLRHLFFAGDENTGRAIAQALGMSPSMAHSVLADLLAEGVVTVREKGRAKLYRMRQGSRVVEKLLAPLFQAERKLLRDVAGEIKAGLAESSREILNVSIFGSVAAGKETERSDLDLLVVLETGRSEKTVLKSLDRLSVVLAREYGINLSPYLVTRAGLKTRQARKLPLISSILGNNQLVYGQPIEKILA